MKTLSQAIKNEENRRVKIIDEISKLLEITINNFHNSLEILDIIIPSANKALLQDSYNIGNITQIISNKKNGYNPSISLTSNKMTLLLQGAIDVTNNLESEIYNLKECLPQIIQQKTILGGVSANYARDNNISENCAPYILGNSKLNFLQTAFLNFISLKEIQNYNIYKFEESPLIYKETFPKSFLVPENISDSRWYDKDYLFIPTLGYVYGGSRNSRIHYEFEPRDCSYDVNLLIGLNQNSFYTGMMHNFKDEKCGEDKVCLSLANYLEKSDHPEQGFVYLKKSHTGLVSEVYTNSFFESLSYNRDMPHMEGYGYNNVSCAGNDCFFFKILSDFHQEL